ncbi:MAG: zinc-binding alcohol dehydrogenase [Paenibacillus sp.]|nr:zinc-binding alcohol dehydrogenase [Paenibacillus sp.]
MRVIIAKGGGILTADEPVPALKPGHALIRTVCSGISPGTELMVARRPNERPAPLGYSAAGYVEDPGDCEWLTAGQRVACYGGPYVRHAEWLSVPRHLAVPIPDSVGFEEAAFVGLGAIAIHALRKAALHFGETVAVVGLGMIGQLVCQIAHAASFRVIAYDLIPERRRKLQEMLPACTVVERLEAMGTAASGMTGDAGVDAVLLCASGADGGMIDAALRWVRDRGHIVVVGDMKLDFNRALMFAKEANLTVSKAGGPGRGDARYELHGNDYPIGFVRWTEGRNMGEYIRLLEQRSIQVEPLIYDRYPLPQVLDAYVKYKEAPERTMGMVIQYDFAP